MLSPFPGMIPYLEHPGLWAGIYHRLITAIANALEPHIQPKHIFAIKERVPRNLCFSKLLALAPIAQGKNTWELGSVLA